MDKWLNDKRNSKNKTYILPYLNSLEIFDKINFLKGECTVLCYKEIDEIAFDRLIEKYNQDGKLRITNRDRLKFFKTGFNTDNKIIRRELEGIFNFNFSIRNFQENSFEDIDLPKDKIVYQITFEDNNIEKFDSTKGVFLIDGKNQIKTTIAEVYEGATIRFYQNTSSSEFKQIMKIFDSDGLLEMFDLYANSWKETLCKLAKEYKGIENLYNKMFVEDKIHWNTFRLYFNEDCKTRFPRESTLKIIKQFCLNNDFKDELIVADFENFKVYSSKDHSIRQQAGVVLRDDLLDYIASNKVEISNSLKKIPSNILSKLVDSIKKGKIKNKKILEDE